MEQNEMNGQNAPNAGVVPPAAPAEPAAPVEPVVMATPPVEQKVEGAKKKNQGIMLAVVLCLILAVGGVGFGIWAMLDGNERAKSQEAQIASLKSQNEELEEQITKLNAGVEDNDDEKEQKPAEAKNWGSPSVQDGIFYVLDADGNVIAQSDATGPVVNELLACESSDDNTILTCTVSTSEGEGQFMYDVYGDSLVSSFEKE